MQTRVKEEEAATFLSLVAAKLPCLLSSLLNQPNHHLFSIYLSPFLKQTTLSLTAISWAERKKPKTKQRNKYGVLNLHLSWLGVSFLMNQSPSWHRGLWTFDWRLCNFWQGWKKARLVSEGLDQAGTWPAQHNSPDQLREQNCSRVRITLLCKSIHPGSNGLPRQDAGTRWKHLPFNYSPWRSASGTSRQRSSLIYLDFLYHTAGCYQQEWTSHFWQTM